MTRSLNRLSAAILIMFLAVAASLMYWSVFAADDILARRDNPRLVEAERMIQRGAIYDRTGQLLAQTVDAGLSPSGKPLTRREYPQPDALSAVGYYSLVHGVGGIEEAFDGTLRGTDRIDFWQQVGNTALHIPQKGSDVRLTLDLSLEGSIVAALKPYHGAVVAVDVPSGAVRAMVSAPSFDANTLDASFDHLLNDPAAPLLNRVTQGVYQPGGALETVILSALLTDKVAIDTPIPNANTPLTLNVLSLTCALERESSTLALAYANACPTPFAQAAVDHGKSIQSAFESFGLLKAPTLAGFRTQAGGPSTPLLAFANDLPLLQAQGAGQGALTVTPLQMALVAATIANHGNAVSLFMADATRAPGTTKWQPLDVPTQQPAVTTQEIANTIRLTMRTAVMQGGAQAASREGLTIYGHASFAYSGPLNNAVSWFIGFADLPSGSSIAVAVVLEGERDPAAAAKVGGVALQAANEMK